MIGDTRRKQGLGEWKELAFREQMSVERDFYGKTPVSFKYAICCGHRTGSNLLSEALFKTGHAGDPMEYYNSRLLKKVAENRNIISVNLSDYLLEMKSRRTSPNGVFGINVKFDQLAACFRNNWQEAIQLIKDNDYVLFLYRKDKLKQAISAYIGQSRDVFNVPADVSDKAVMELVGTVPFNPQKISENLSRALSIEQSWLQFFARNNITYESLAYEDFINHYDYYIDYLLDKFHVPVDERSIPQKPMKKIANNKNEELRSRYIDFISSGIDSGNAQPFQIPIP